jgi:hypothetical protein
VQRLLRGKDLRVGLTLIGSDGSDIEHLAGCPPFGLGEAAAMSAAVSPSSGKPHGTARVCRLVFLLVSWHVSRATLYRHRQPPMPKSVQRPGPAGPMPGAELTETEPLWRTVSCWQWCIFLGLCHEEIFIGSRRQVWTRLCGLFPGLGSGSRTSRKRICRLMRSMPCGFFWIGPAGQGHHAGHAIMMAP